MALQPSSIRYCFQGFLDGLDSLHYFIDHVVYQTRLSGPSFRCEPQTDGTLRLHYYSKRNGLYPIVIGSYIKKAYPWCKRHETNLTDILELIHPEVPLTFESIMVFKNSQFVCKLKDIDGQESNVKAVMVKGSMTIVDNGQFMVYLCSLYVTTVRELIDRNLHLSDIQGHDGTRDLIMLNQSRLSQVELNRRLEETTKNLKRMASELETEKHKTDELLSQLMPISVAEALRQGTSVEACNTAIKAIAMLKSKSALVFTGEFAEATLLFTDIVTFTNICAQCTPYDVVTLLNDLYLRFDRLVGLHDVYKVETIGDAYMIVGGVPNKCANHAERVLNVSIGTIMESKSVMSPITNRHIQIRAGVHTGAVVAGVVGVKMPRYCLFGDAVNTANRMESCGIPGRIHVSDPTKKAALQMNPSFVFADRGNVEIKGKGTMHTYFLERNDRKSVWEICNRQRGEGSCDPLLLSIERFVMAQISFGVNASCTDVRNSKQMLLVVNSLTNGPNDNVIIVSFRCLRYGTLKKSHTENWIEKK
ncbi:unnamed protein product [Toxocara canis]|uniref:guanylate cyclase n=1 Tax=Toxocara canis TaxID=6265 RepID=A0A3P7ERU6_TOXCA|nr:unnamed protein product [Toxocara canis]